MASDSARRASLGASLQSRFDGLLKGLTVQAGAVCPLRGVAIDVVDVRQRVTMSRYALVPVGSSFGMWISVFFLKTHLDRRRAAAGARAKPAEPGRRALRRGGPLRRPSLRRHNAHPIHLRGH